MAEFDIGVIKRHPYLLGGIVLIVGGYIFYRIYKSSASPSDLSSEAQFQQLQSAQQLQNSQIQGQLDLAQGQSNAQIAVINASYAGQLSLAEQGQKVYDDYLKTQTDLATISSTTTIDVAKIQADAYTDIAQMQAAVAAAQVDAQNQRTEYAFALGMAATSHEFTLTSTGIGGTTRTLSGSFASAYDEARGKAADIVAAFLGSASYSGSTQQSTSKGFSVGIPGIGGFSIGGL